jgi:hypothetical protein
MCNMSITICLTCHKTDNNMSYVSQHWQVHLCLLDKASQTRIIVSYNICVSLYLGDILYSYWYIISVFVLHANFIFTLTKISLTYHNTDNNMSYVSEHWQQYVLHITYLTTICLRYHNTDNNMSYGSQHWQQYILRASVVTRKTYYCQRCDT